MPWLHLYDENRFSHVEAQKGHNTQTEYCSIVVLHIRAASRENLSSRFPTRSDTNRAVKPQKIGRGLKFLIYEEEGFYHLCSVNKALISCTVTAQLIYAFVCTYAKSRLSHNAAHIYTGVHKSMHFFLLWFYICAFNINHIDLASQCDLKLYT